MSSAPVCSPTPIICTTIGGNTPVSISGSAIVRPSRTFSAVSWIADSTITLPDAFPTMSIASRMGTPEPSRVPSVRVKRATAIFRITGPMMGKVRNALCQNRFPPGVR